MKTANSKAGQVCLPAPQLVNLSEIRPSRENDLLYRPIDPTDASFLSLVASVKANGVLEPVVVTLDGYIASGHRRHAAAKQAKLTQIPVRWVNFRRTDDPDRFLRLLREHNRQREKTLEEKLREELVAASPAEAYKSLIEHREERARLAVAAMEIVGSKKRKAISAAKRPMLEAAIKAINARRRFWPLSDRVIHYELSQNLRPLRHSAKPGSVYVNDRQSYQDLCDLVTRARLTGEIPFDAIADETRPVTVWTVHRTPSAFMKAEFDGLLTGYWRDLLQSQPNHVEIVGEKNTLAGIIRPVAMKFCIPFTLGRGYCSVPPRHEMARRFRRSGKAKLVILVLSDFDPEGDDIAQSFAKSMRDDFGIKDIHPVRVALTTAQVAEHKLPPMQVKKKSARARKFIAQHGESVYELEALKPEALQAILTQAIDSVIDGAAFNAELDLEEKDAAFLDAVRQRVRLAVRDVNHGRPNAGEEVDDA